MQYVRLFPQKWPILSINHQSSNKQSSSEQDLNSQTSNIEPPSSPACDYSSRLTPARMSMQNISPPPQQNEKDAGVPYAFNPIASEGWKTIQQKSFQKQPEGYLPDVAADDVKNVEKQRKQETHSADENSVEPPTNHNVIQIRPLPWIRPPGDDSKERNTKCTSLKDSVLVDPSSSQQPKPTSPCGIHTEPTLEIPTAGKNKVVEPVCSPRTQALTLLRGSNAQSTNHQQTVLGVVNPSPSQIQKVLPPLTLPLMTFPAVVKPSPRSHHADSSQTTTTSMVSEKVNTPPPVSESDRTIVRLPAMPKSPALVINTQEDTKALSCEQQSSSSSLTTPQESQESPSGSNEVITQIQGRLLNEEKTTEKCNDNGDKQALSETREVLREGPTSLVQSKSYERHGTPSQPNQQLGVNSSVQTCSDMDVNPSQNSSKIKPPLMHAENKTCQIESFSRPVDSSEKTVSKSPLPECQTNNAPNHSSPTNSSPDLPKKPSQGDTLPVSTVPTVQGETETSKRRITRSSIRVTRSSASSKQQTPSHSSSSSTNSRKRSLPNPDFAKNTIAIGEVGYTFEKFFPNHGVFRGRVAKIDGE